MVEIMQHHLVGVSTSVLVLCDRSLREDSRVFFSLPFLARSIVHDSPVSRFTRRKPT